MVCTSWRNISLDSQELWEIKFRKEFSDKNPRYFSWKLSFVRESLYLRATERKKKRPTMVVSQISNQNNQFTLQYPTPSPGHFDLVKSEDGRSARFEKKMGKVAQVVQEHPGSNIRRFDWRNFRRDDPPLNPDRIIRSFNKYN